MLTMTKVDTNYPLTLILNCDKTGASSPEQYMESGYEVFYNKTCQISGHNLIDKFGNCLNCNSHLLKSLERDVEKEFIHVVTSSDGVFTSIVSANTEDEALTKAKSSRVINSIEWVSSHGTQVESPNFDLAVENLKSMEISHMTAPWGKEFETPYIYACPKELVLFTIRSITPRGVQEITTRMFAHICRGSHSIENALSTFERRFLEDHKIALIDLIDAGGLKTHEYKAELSKTGKLLAINAYPCNAHGHKIRNINNACVMCHPDKIYAEKFTPKTPELKFIEKNKIPNHLVLDLKLEANKDFKSILSLDSEKTIAIHTYRCKKCGLGVRNSSGSCLNCKSKKLNEAISEKNN